MAFYLSRRNQPHWQVPNKHGFECTTVKSDSQDYSFSSDDDEMLPIHDQYSESLWVHGRREQQNNNADVRHEPIPSQNPSVAARQVAPAVANTWLQMANNKDKFGATTARPTSRFVPSLRRSTNPPHAATRTINPPPRANPPPTARPSAQAILREEPLYDFSMVSADWLLPSCTGKKPQTQEQNSSKSRGRRILDRLRNPPGLRESIQSRMKRQPTKDADRTWSGRAQQQEGSFAANTCASILSDPCPQSSYYNQDRSQPARLFHHEYNRHRVSLFDSPSDSPPSSKSAQVEPVYSWFEQRRLREQNQAAQWNNDNNFIIMGKSKGEWKTAVDPKSGKTYYYHSVTRETQWRKPMELASAEEKEAMEEKEKRQRDFFSAMEANILKNLQSGVLPSPAPAERSKKIVEDIPEENKNEEEDLTKLARPQFVRTISSMDERVLRDIVMRVPSHRNLMDAGDLGRSGSLQSIGKMDSEGSLEPLVDTTSSGQATKPAGLRASLRQVSLGTMLATLPEEEASLNAIELDFGDEGQLDIGLSQLESAALSRLSQVTSEMAMVDEETISEMGESFEALMEEEDLESKDSPAQKLNETDEPEDPLANMDDAPRLGRDAVSARNVSSSAMARPVMPSRRNTCGTIYVGSTMAAPDVDATIKCVCGVVRAHILQSEIDRDASDDYVIFNDQESRQKKGSNSGRRKRDERPSLDQITTFYRDVFGRAQMESDCVIMSLIYVERLIKNTRGELRPRASNWRSVLFSCMVLASKVWDDLSMWNGDFSQTCPAGVTFTLQRINELELAVLDALEYIVKVPASEYAKYYFLLRSMLIKSGLGGEDLNEMNPLDVEGARRLQAVSSKYQRAATLRQVGNRTGGRSKSLTINLIDGGDRRKIGLEHIVDL